MLIDKEQSLFWWSGENVYTNISKNSEELKWITKILVSTAKTISWDVSQVKQSFGITWSTDGTVGLKNVNPASFYAKHTGEVNSGQVIRFRSAIDPSKIIFESFSEEDPTGSINVFAQWDDMDLRSKVLVNQFLLSYLDLTTGKWKIYRPTTELSKYSIPVYVTHEYDSTTEYKYIIRYLGYISSDVAIFSNGPRRLYNLDEQARSYGIALTQLNKTNKDLNINIAFTNGKIFSAIWPKNTALAVLKIDEKTRTIGYIEEAGLVSLSGEGISPPVEYYKKYFKALI